MKKTGLHIEALPYQVFRAIHHHPGAILLETQRPSSGNRHSFVAWAPEKIFKGEVTEVDKSAFFSFISSMAPNYFIAGYIGYEACQWVETLPLPGAKDTRNPHIYLAAYPQCLVFDHIRQTWQCWHKKEISYPPAAWKSKRQSSVGRIKGFNQNKVTYLEHVRRVLDYIRAGDVYQINYTQRVYFTYPGDPYDLYLRLKEVQPVSYGAFLNLGDGLIVSGSPELFLRLHNRRILSKPMKGTRKRSREPAADENLRKELKESEKDRAENTMIVDLMRNDLGRFCQFGSIEVARPYVVEAYDTVFQMVSYVKGLTRKDASTPEIIRAAFPPGSITGAPKKRAMEIIYELEPHQRGVYCGAIGYFLEDTMVLNVAIRTLELWDGQGVLGVGGGIVADSDPELEYEESMIKAKASLVALGIEE
jgi:para-aminobenzoate synthetase component 1